MPGLRRQDHPASSAQDQSGAAHRLPVDSGDLSQSVLFRERSSQGESLDGQPRGARSFTAEPTRVPRCSDAGPALPRSTCTSMCVPRCRPVHRDRPKAPWVDVDWLTLRVPLPAVHKSLCGPRRSCHRLLIRARQRTLRRERTHHPESPGICRRSRAEQPVVRRSTARVRRDRLCEFCLSDQSAALFSEVEVGAAEEDSKGNRRRINGIEVGVGGTSFRSLGNGNASETWAYVPGYIRRLVFFARASRAAAADASSPRPSRATCSRWSACRQASARSK